MVQSSFYSDTPNYATDYPTQNDSNTNNGGNTTAPSSFYPDGGVFEALANSDTVVVEMTALEAATAAAAASASTSASGASASAAAALASQGAAASSASAASTSASNAATSATNAHNSELNAASSASSASTSATNAGNSATAAAGSASSASGSATSASGSASSASTSATNASASASAASTSATNAASSASAAATSAANAAAAVSAAAGTATPAMDGTAAVGTGTKWAHEDHVHPTDTTRAPLASPAFTGTPTAPTATLGDNSTKLATTAFVLANAAADPSLLRGYLSGLTLSTAGSSATFGIAAGVAVDSTHANFMKIASAYTKTTSAWAVGTGNGAMDTGSVAANTWYHVHLIKRLDTLVVDVLFSLSATAPTLPTNYTVFRRIGSMKTDGSSQWIKFIQNGDNFMWAAPVADVAATNPGTAAVTRVISTPPGLIVEAIIGSYVDAASAADVSGGVYISDLALTDIAAGGAAFSFFNFTSATGHTLMGSQVRVNTNTSSSVRTRLASSAAGTTFGMTTLGWNDRRGRDA